MSTQSTGKVWFVTGASVGLGRAIVVAAAAAGDRVVTTARKVQDVADLAGDDVLALPLDVTVPDQVTDAVAAALDRFGRIDVIVNNAGYGIRGAVEELSDDELDRIFDTNVFGVARMTRAVLPVMRSQGTGQVIQMSSVGGVSAALGGSAYASTKFALEGMSEALAQEVAPFGVKVTLVEPGPFRTEFAGRSQAWATPLPAYEPILGEARKRFKEQHDKQPGDPAKAADVIVQLTRMDDPPLRVPLGPQSFDRIRATLSRRLAELDEVETLGRSTSYDDATGAG